MRDQTWMVLALLGGCVFDDDPCARSAPSTICTIAGTGERGFAEDGIDAVRAPLYVPMDIAVAPDGQLWLLDFNNYVVRAIDGRGRMRRVVGNGLLGSSPPPGVASVPAREAELNHIGNLAFHDGHAYLAAWHNSTVHRVNVDTTALEVFAGTGRRTYYDGDGGPALAASLDLPSAIAVSPSGTVVITDQGNQVLREVLADGTIRTIAGMCITDFTRECAPGAPLLACPGSNKRTCHPSQCGDWCAPGFGGDDGPALEARFDFGFGASLPPYGRLAYDLAGDLLVADTGNHRIRKIDRAGIITTIAGTGVRGYAGDDGPATAAQLDTPVDLAVDADGSIYLTDVENHCIRKIAPDGIIRRVAGVCGERDGGFAGDGDDPLLARLDRPYGIELAGDRLYIADTYNDRIRVVNLP